ncbi:acetate/propionate family kinase [Luteococcus sp. Sow4_B9]|uniref:acetate/propionate family kinase n=1 Tax=Luteococcus sp. Sow4_B9 TaxID=3438792 RepID=UPI003F94C8F2
MPKPILLLNCGSSSIKYQMIDADTEAVMAVGLVQKVGEPTPGTIDHEVDGEEFHDEVYFPSHTEAIAAVVKMFDTYGPDIIDAVAVGHRTVHGGTDFNSTTVIDQAVINKLVELSGLAPLHNPPGIAGIRAAREILPDVPHVAVFDTAFFAELPAEAYTYAIDREVARKYQIRRYGFHGTSHQYVSGQAAAFLGKDISELKQIVCHLGNGASLSAIDGGHPIETTMGLTPLQGLVMGTRSGDVDPGLHAYLGRVMNLDVAGVDSLLNKRSGMFGLTGKTDMRDIDKLIEAGDEDARVAMDVYVHRLVGYIGNYATHLGGLDCITFTAGVGENASNVRKMVVDKLGIFGAELDDEANSIRSKQPRRISTLDSAVEVLVIPTNEELAMVRETIKAIGG